MDHDSGSFVSMVRRPSTLVLLGLSVTALAVVLVHAALFGAMHEQDEGAAAHIWQMLFLAQVPAGVFFAVRWLPTATRQALLVLLVLAVTTAANLAAVYFLT